MKPTEAFAGDRLEPIRPDRMLWIALIATSAIFLSTFFACATPFAAFATLAALKLGRRDAFIVVGLVWLANEAIGYGLLGYPWTAPCAAWGLAIGVASILAVLAANGLSTTKPAPLAVSLPFVAAFTAFEMALYVAGFALPGSEGAFSAAVIGNVFLINAAALCGLMAAHQMAMLIGHLARHAPAAPLAAGIASFR